MRLFIRGQEIATRTENLIQDQDVTDEVLNSVPIVLVTANKEPEPEPDVIWTRQISNDVIFDATLEYNVTRNTLRVCNIYWNEIFGNNYGSRYHIQLIPQNTNGIYIDSAGFLGGRAHNSFCNYLNEEGMEIFKLQEHLINNHADGTLYISEPLNEETFNNLEFKTFYEFDHTNTGTPNLELLRKYVTIMNFYGVEQYKYYLTRKETEQDSPGTFEGCIAYFNRENLIDLPGIIHLYMSVKTSFDRNTWLLTMSNSYDNPGTLPNNFWLGAVDYLNTINGEYESVTGEISVELLTSDQVMNTWALNSEDCPFYVECGVDGSSEIAFLKAKEYMTIPSGEGLYLSNMPREFNVDWENLMSGKLYLEKNWEGNTTVTYNVGDVVSSTGTLQIWSNGLDYETCNNLITEKASISKVYYDNTIREREV